MPRAPLAVTFIDDATGQSLARLGFSSIPTLPRAGENVQLPDGVTGSARLVEWRLTKSRFWGTTADVEVRLSLRPNATKA